MPVPRPHRRPWPRGVFPRPPPGTSSNLFRRPFQEKSLALVHERSGIGVSRRLWQKSTYDEAVGETLRRSMTIDPRRSEQPRARLEERRRNASASSHAARAHAITDVDGRSYVDLVCSWGPLIFGHAHPSVVRAVQDAAARGVSFGAPTPGEVELAREIVGIYPVDREGSARELRAPKRRCRRSASRGPSRNTGYREVRRMLPRPRRCAARSRRIRVERRSARRIAKACRKPSRRPRVWREFNDARRSRGVLRSHGREIAAVIIEPVVGNMGVVLPKPGFLEDLRKLTRRSGTLLIFDEVITGFRLAKGGVQELTGIAADLTCLGKILGGGLPVAAFGGRRATRWTSSRLSAGCIRRAPSPEIPSRSQRASPRFVSSAPRSYARLEALGARLQEKLRRVLRDRRVPAVLNRAGSMFTLFFGVEPGAELQRSDARRTRRPTPGSSTGCSSAGSIYHRRSSRRRFSRSHTARQTSMESPRPLRKPWRPL